MSMHEEAWRNQISLFNLTRRKQLPQPFDWFPSTPKSCESGMNFKITSREIEASASAPVVELFSLQLIDGIS